MQETRGLYTQIGTLKRLLTENGIQIPAEKLKVYQNSTSEQDIPDGSFELSIETMKMQFQHRQQRIRAQRGGSNSEHCYGHRQGQLLDASLRDKSIAQNQAVPSYGSRKSPA